MKQLGRSAICVVTMLSLFSLPALAGDEFSEPLKCAKGLERYAVDSAVFLKKNTRQPGTLETVGYKVEGKNAGRSGFYLYRDSEAYFVPYPKDAKQYRNSKFPNADPETFIWAEIPQKGSSKTDNFQMTIQGGRVVSWADEVGFKDRKKMWPETEKLFKEYMVTAKGSDAVGPEARDTLIAALAAHIDLLPNRFQSELSNAKAKRGPWPNKARYLAALDGCASVDGGKLKDTIAQAKFAMIGPTVGGSSQQKYSDQEHGAAAAK